MNTHQVFQTVKTHLLAQGRRSEDANGNSVYRSPTGLKCAIGALIPNEIYKPECEGQSVSFLTIENGFWMGRREPELATILNVAGIEATEEMRALLRLLQRIHDRQHPGDWEENLYYADPL